MRRAIFVAIVSLLSGLGLLYPVAAAAQQASVAGAVTDGSGAVLPGVVVEASSAALIEKTRSVVTDGTGQYRIVGLPSGTYTVTYTLTGFNIVKREGVELAGALTDHRHPDARRRHRGIGGRHRREPRRRRAERPAPADHRRPGAGGAADVALVQQRAAARALGRGRRRQSPAAADDAPVHRAGGSTRTAA